MDPPGADITQPTFVAIDAGKKFWASEDGIAANVYIAREPGARAGKSRIATDFIRLAAQYFERGLDVVTEAPTVGSFGTRGRDPEMAALLAAYPDRTLWEVNAHAARNECRRHGIGSNGPLDDSEAAAAIWRITKRHGAKRWRPGDETLRPYRVDELRPHLHVFVQLRNYGYPPLAMEQQIFRYLPSFNALADDYQRLVVGNQDGYAPDRAAALVLALHEPASRKRDGFERVIGAYRDSRPSAYRQVLVVGKPRKDYRYGYHFTGLTFRDWRSAIRRLRTDVLPGILDPADAGTPYPERRSRPAGIETPVIQPGITLPVGQTVLPI